MQDPQHDFFMQSQNDYSEMNKQLLHSKKSKTRTKKLSVSFDPQDRKNYVTGFQFRKNQRRKVAQEQKENLEKQKRVEKRIKLRVARRGGEEFNEENILAPTDSKNRVHYLDAVYDSLQIEDQNSNSQDDDENVIKHHSESDDDTVTVVNITKKSDQTNDSNPLQDDPQDTPFQLSDSSDDDADNKLSRKRSKNKNKDSSKNQDESESQTEQYVFFSQTSRDNFFNSKKKGFRNKKNQPKSLIPSARKKRFQGRYDRNYDRKTRRMAKKVRKNP